MSVKGKFLYIILFVVVCILTPMIMELFSFSLGDYSVWIGAQNTLIVVGVFIFSASILITGVYIRKYENHISKIEEDTRSTIKNRDDAIKAHGNMTLTMSHSDVLVSIANTARKDVPLFHQLINKAIDVQMKAILEFRPTVEENFDVKGTEKWFENLRKENKKAEDINSILENLQRIRDDQLNKFIYKINVTLADKKEKLDQDLSKQKIKINFMRSSSETLQILGLILVLAQNLVS